MGAAHRLLLALLLVAVPCVGVAADDEPERPIPPPGFVEVPDVRRLPPERAARQLVFAGLNPGRLFERKAQAGWTLGRVLQQRPPPGTVLAWGTKVDLAIAASENGPAGGRPPPANWPRVALPGPPAPPAPPTARGPATVPGDRIPPPPPAPPAELPPSVPAPAPRNPSAPPPPPPPPALPGALPPAGEPPATEPAPSPEAPAVPPPQAPEPPPAPPAEAPVVPGAPEVPVELPPAPPAADPEVATGSPDAPEPAPPVDPAVTPALIGLPLADAEHLAVASDMQLHVERVPGHPVGRVKAQVPEPGAPRPPAGVVAVEVTAGGDHVAELAPAPLVAVTEIAVPDLLDRTELQARRILEDLGLEPQIEEAARGPAGRVADQRPDAGTVVAKGSKVIVRVAPGARTQPTPRPAPPAPAPVPEETPPPAGFAPTPLSPAGGTLMGAERTIAIGFTWRPLPAADAYVLEVEEQGPDGWLPLARTSARAAAAVLSVERLAPSPGPLRWRVRAVTQGRQGPPCAWVVLR